MKTTTNINPNSNRNAMIRKLTLPLAAAAAALALLAACTAADPLADDRPLTTTPADDDPRRPVPIRLEPACVAMPDAADADAAPGDPASAATTPGATRAVMNPDYSNSWQEGDAVGLYIVKGDAGLQSDGSNWVNNLKMTYTGGKWQYTLPEGKECYPSDGEKLSFYAYHPYLPYIAGNRLPFVYADDQRNAYSVRIYHAQTTGVGKTHDPVPLAFVPLAAMVEVKVKNSAKGHPGGRASELLVVTLQGCKREFTYWLGTWPDPVEPGTHSVIFRRVEQPGDAGYATSYTYRALIPAQTLPRGTQLVFSHSPVWTDHPGDQPQLRYTLPKDMKLEWGHYNRFEVTLEPKGTLERYLYKVGVLYPSPGDCGLPLGVVYETEGGATSGEHGKIVGLSEVNHLQWGTEDPLAPGYAGIATPDKDNGRVNMNTLYGASGGSFPATYPLFRWAAGLNASPPDYADRAQKGVWYVPAEKEALEMLIQTDKINKALKSAGYKEMNEAGKTYFMTSTSDEGQFIGLDYLNGRIIANNCPKSQTGAYWCRPILEF